MSWGGGDRINLSIARIATRCAPHGPTALIDGSLSTLAPAGTYLGGILHEL